MSTDTWASQKPAPRPIDPFASAPAGRYQDDLVVVTRRRGPRSPRAHGAVRTHHFDLWRDGARLHLEHALPKHRIDNDLAGLLADELFGPGWVSGSDAFERMLTGIVLGSAGDPTAAWELFYRNTLRRLEFLQLRDAAGERSWHGSLAEYAPVYSHAIGLVPFRSVLDVGCSFGFLSLQLALRGSEITASDVSAGTVELLTHLSSVLGYPLNTLVCDAARVPRPDGAFDAVAVLHLLEHLDPVHGEAVVAEAVRLARHRVVVAVPYEDEPTAAFGHVRTIDAEDLAALGHASGWHFNVHTHHGGWLVLDQPG